MEPVVGFGAPLGSDVLEGGWVMVGSGSVIDGPLGSAACGDELAPGGSESPPTGAVTDVAGAGESSHFAAATRGSSPTAAPAATARIRDLTFGTVAGIRTSVTAEAAESPQRPSPGHGFGP